MKKMVDSRIKFSSFPFGNHCCCWKSIFKLKFWQKLLPNNQQQNLNDNDGDYRTGTTRTTKTTATSTKTNKRNSCQVSVGGKIRIENGNGSHRYLGKQQQQQQQPTVPEPRTKNGKVDCSTESGNKKQHSKQETKQQQRRRKMKIIVFYANDHPNWFQPNNQDNILFNEFNNNNDDDDVGHQAGCGGGGGVGTLLNQCCCVSNNQQHRHDNNHVLMEKMFQLTMINVNDYHHQQRWNVGNTMNHHHGHHGNSILSEIFDKLFGSNPNQEDWTDEPKKDQEEEEEEEEEEEREEYSENDSLASLDGFGFCIIISDQMTQFINDDILDIERCLSFVLGACSTEPWRNWDNNRKNGDIMFSDQITIPICDSDDMNKFITYALYDELNEINMFRIKYKLCHCAFIPVTIPSGQHNEDDSVNGGHRNQWTTILFNGIIRISNENLFIRYQNILHQQHRQLQQRKKRRQPRHERCQPQPFSNEAAVAVAKEEENDDEKLYGFCSNNFRDNFGAGTNFENPYDEGCLFRVFPNSIKKPNEQILVMLDHHHRQHQVNNARCKYPGNHHPHHHHYHHQGHQRHLDVLLNGQSTINWLQLEWINDSMFLIRIPEAFFQPNTETLLNITIIIDCRQVLGSRMIKCDAIGSDDVLGDASMAIQATKLELLETILFSKLNSDQFLCQTFSINSLDELDENFAKIFDESLTDFGIFQYISQPFNINLWLPTWLHFAAAHGLSRLLAKLLSSPASIPACFVKNSAGLDAIELARKYHHENIVEILEKHLEQIKHMKQDSTMLITEQIQSKIIVNRLGPGGGNDEIESQMIQNDRYNNNNKINKNEKNKKIGGKEHDHRTLDNRTKKTKKKKNKKNKIHESNQNGFIDVIENNDDDNNKNKENETRFEKNDAFRMLESKTDNRTTTSTMANIVNLTPSQYLMEKPNTDNNNNDDDNGDVQQCEMSIWNEKILNSKYELLFIIDQFKKGISIQTFRELFQQWETVYQDVLKGQMSDEFLHSFNEIKKLCRFSNQPLPDLVVDDDDDLSDEKNLDDNGYSEPPKISRPFHKCFSETINTPPIIHSTCPLLLAPPSSTFKYEIDLV